MTGQPWWNSPHRPGKGDRRSQRSVLQGIATRLGVTLEEYVRRLDNGERWCGHHKRWELSAGFLKRKTSPDGFASECKESLKERARARKDGSA